MAEPLVFAFPEQEILAKNIAEKLQLALGVAEIRYFPDDESYVRICSDVRNRTIILVTDLAHPNHKILPLMFMAETLKELGANRIILVAPYLPYMRQDKRFNSGEAVSAILFAKYLSSWVDGLVTVDPHLHRIDRLTTIYSAPAVLTLHAAEKIAAWIYQNVPSPLIIGPDAESEQWVSEVARGAKAEYVILEKIRLGDREVRVSIPKIMDTSKTPVLVDDMISTGTSMIATIKKLLASGFQSPVCVAVHGLFCGHAYQDLLQAGAKQVVTCNTIAHSSNQIDVSDLIAKNIKDLF